VRSRVGSTNSGDEARLLSILVMHRYGPGGQTSARQALATLVRARAQDDDDGQSQSRRMGWQSSPGTLRRDRCGRFLGAVRPDGVPHLVPSTTSASCQPRLRRWLERFLMGSWVCQRSIQATLSERTILPSSSTAAHSWSTLASMAVSRLAVALAALESCLLAPLASASASAASRKHW
jgi:hypothetical protein